MLHLCHNYCDRRSKRFVVSCSVNPRIAKGWQSCDPLCFMAIFLQYEELGFSPLCIPPEILSARGEVKMSEIVHHGAT